MLPDVIDDVLKGEDHILRIPALHLFVVLPYGKIDIPQLRGPGNAMDGVSGAEALNAFAAVRMSLLFNDRLNVTQREVDAKGYRFTSSSTVLPGA